MDTARQILRWGIPGWLCISAFLAYWVVMLRFARIVHIYDLVCDIQTKGIGIETAAVLGALGIPLGYLIYQLYYFSYGNVWIPFDISSLDRGLLVLSGLPPRTIARIRRETGSTSKLAVMTEPLNFPLFEFPFYRLKKKHRNKEGRREYEANLSTNWEILRYYLTHIGVAVGTPDVGKEFATLSDIYHSLGASRMALFIAWLTTFSYIPLKLLLDPKSDWRETFLGTLAGLASVTIIAFAAHRVLSRTRTKAFASSIAFLRQAIHSYFSGSLRG